MRCKLRPVNELDVKLLYDWRNDTLVRKNSFNDGLVEYAEHKRWFESALTNSNIFFYILECDEEPIGQVRLNKIDTSCVVSYSIAERYRAQGYGKLILQLLENECVQKNLAESLIGYVKKENIASQIIFKSLGYTESDEGNFYRYEKFSLQHIDEINMKAGGGYWYSLTIEILYRFILGLMNARVPPFTAKKFLYR